jgi:hypothetical protein
MFWEFLKDGVDLYSKVTCVALKTERNTSRDKQPALESNMCGAEDREKYLEGQNSPGSNVIYTNLVVD